MGHYPIGLYLLLCFTPLPQAHDGDIERLDSRVLNRRDECDLVKKSASCFMNERLKVNYSGFNVLTKKMIVDLNMLGALTEDIIMCNIDGTLVVTLKRSGMFDMDAHVMEETMKPYQFRCGMCKGTIFGFGKEARDHKLFLAFLGYERVT